MSVELQTQDSEIKQFVDGIVPTLNGMLKSRWDRLLWEPEIKIDPNRPITGLVIEETLCSEDGRFVHYVTPEGIINLSTFRPTSNGGYRYLDGGGYEQTSPQNYLRLAPDAGSFLRRLREEQGEELRSDLEGREVIWRPGVDLFGLRYKHVVERAIFVEHLKFWAKDGKIGCPVHGTELSRVSGQEGRYLKCLVPPHGHLELFAPEV